jgi:hypothetical protein
MVDGGKIYSLFVIFHADLTPGSEDLGELIRYFWEDIGKDKWIMMTTLEELTLAHQGLQDTLRLASGGMSYAFGHGR